MANSSNTYSVGYNSQTIMDNGPEYGPALTPPDDNIAPAAGLFNGATWRARPSAPTPTPAASGGFLSEIERLPHFGVPSAESFTRNFLKGRSGVFFVDP